MSCNGANVVRVKPVGVQRPLLPPMDIKEIREEKAKLELVIADLLNNFSSKTGLTVVDLDLTPIYQGIDEKVVKTYVRAEIQL